MALFRRLEELERKRRTRVRLLGGKKRLASKSRNHSAEPPRRSDDYFGRGA
jgi:hypothetical protein